jgi:hypothetical protein
VLIFVPKDGFLIGLKRWPVVISENSFSILSNVKFRIHPKIFTLAGLDSSSKERTTRNPGDRALIARNHSTARRRESLSYVSTY